MSFKLESKYIPSGDQPSAIQTLVDGLNYQKKHQVLLGVTGSGKTFTVANVIEQMNQPVLVLAHNKTLAAQLCSEFKTFFPSNAVEYFVSYYDYYQPEAYVASRDLFIEKEAQINDEIERLRHSATRALFSRRDVIIVASVSCIYGLGTPSEYFKGVLRVSVGDNCSRLQFMRSLTDIYYDRNDLELKRGRFRVRGDCIDIFPSWDETAVRIELFGDDVDRICQLHPVSGEIIRTLDSVDIFPASHYVVSGDMEDAISAIEYELNERLAEFSKRGCLVEAQRLKQRTMYDIEMMREMGYCKGIENYSRHLSGTSPGEPSGVLLDFFQDDFITIIDESHVTIPQVGGMFNGDRARKQSLVEHGFRLPSALDNRPLRFDEFEQKLQSVIYVSATPGKYELEKVRVSNPKGKSLIACHDVVEQVIRPTGLLDPVIILRPTTGQMDHLLSEINRRIDRDERSLVTAVTKQLSEDIAQYLSEFDIKVRYLHSDIGAMERIDILRDLRLGIFDVLVGVNLLREGLDLPEVSLVAILDADKEGFLRNERSLIQTMGRAARHVDGTVILYADKRTPSMAAAISETKRRRKKQQAFNQKHGQSPTPIVKDISDIRDDQRQLIESMDEAMDALPHDDPNQRQSLIESLTQQMNDAAAALEFETAAVLRDKIDRLIKES